jgi:signal transduction histidine kinase
MDILGNTSIHDLIIRWLAHFRELGHLPCICARIKSEQSGKYLHFKSGDCSDASDCSCHWMEISSKWMQGQLITPHNFPGSIPQLMAALPLFISGINSTYSLRDMKLLRIKSQIGEMLKHVTQGWSSKYMTDVCQLLSDFYEAERSTLYFWDEDKKKLRSAFGEGLKAVVIELDPGQGLAGRCAELIEPVLSNDMQRDSDVSKKTDSKTSFVTKSSLCIPVTRGQVLLGVIQILNRESGFLEEHVTQGYTISETLSLHYEILKGRAVQDSRHKQIESLIESLPDMVFKIDESGYFSFLSNQISQWGYDSSQLLHHHFSEILHPDDYRECAREFILPQYKGIKTGKELAPKLFDERRAGFRDTKSLILRFRNPSDPDDYYYGEVNSSGYWRFDSMGIKTFQGTIGMIRDVTRRYKTEGKLKKLREDFFKAERLAELGTLAAGIAHDFNNALNVIGMETDINIMKLEQGIDAEKEELEHSFLKIEKGVKQAGSLARKLLSLGGGNQSSRLEECDIRAILDEAMELMETRLIQLDIDFLINCPSEPMLCMAEKSALRDIFINLFTNSIHAIDEAIKKSLPEPMKLHVKVNKKGKMLRILVEDTGAGIPVAVRNRIFDPFFTTKTAQGQKGTGLGLSMVFNTIKRFGGSTVCESVHASEDPINRGTRFYVSLPMAGTTPLKESDSGLCVVVLGSSKFLEKAQSVFQHETACRLLSFHSEEAFLTWLGSENRIHTPECVIVECVADRLPDGFNSATLRVMQQGIPVLYYGECGAVNEGKVLSQLSVSEVLRHCF